MKAAIVERPGELVVRSVPEPEMGPYDAFCELLYGATCTGTDQHILHGRLPWTIQYPTIVGHESIGRVLRVGPKVRNLKPGDLVTRAGSPAVGDVSATWGGFAEYGIARDYRAMRDDDLPREAWDGARVNQVLPAGTDPAAATMIITWRETLSYLTRIGLREGDAVLIIGSGGNGLAFVSHARNAGAGSVACLGAAAREGTVSAAGASVFADYRSPDAYEQLRDARPEGFDLIVDAVGRQGALDAALPLLRDRGTVGIYGIDDFGKCTLTPSHARGSFTFAERGYDEEETHDRVVDLMLAGLLDAGVWLDLDHPWPLDDIGGAFDAIRERKVVKALVRLSG